MGWIAARGPKGQLFPHVAVGASFAGLLAVVGCAVDPSVTSGGNQGLTLIPGLTGDDAGVGLDDGGFGFGGPVGLSTPFQPRFGPLTIAANPPPTISGGTLLVTRDGARAVAADPDRDAVYVVNLATKAVAFTIPLHAGDEPGRVVEDVAGHVHVALRGGGALVTLDVTKGTVLSRRAVCPAPRGVAYDSAADALWVACATGELVSLPAAGGAATKTLVVERDLRDVIVRSGAVAVSQFRTAQVLNLDGSGAVVRRDQLPSPLPLFTPQVAWRTVAGPSGTLVAVHQAESTQSIATHNIGGYGGGCGGMFIPQTNVGPTSIPDAGASFASCGVAAPDAGSDDAGIVGESDTGASSPDAGAFGPVPQNLPPPPPPGLLGGCGSAVVSSVLTVLGPDGSALVNTTFAGTLPVDVAVSADGTTIAAVAPGNAFSGTGPQSNVFMFTNCGVVATATVDSQASMSAQVTAVAFDSSNDVVVQSREPAFLAILQAGTGTATRLISLSSTSRDDTGHDVFHTQAGASIACASCHPEGRDDGHVWKLDGQLRRTPSLRGTIAGTAPYHWPGDEANLDVLVNDVYTVRMGGVMLDQPTMGALTSWVQHVPALPAPAWVDAAAAARGKTLFERSDVGCATCHSGAKLTNNTTVDVGTGGSFQVPPLVGVGWRTPLFHDGCAATIADRFGACATSKHGSTGVLSPGDVSDVVAYLDSL